jgi:hypothetical protein
MGQFGTIICETWAPKSQKVTTERGRPWAGTAVPLAALCPQWLPAVIIIGPMQNCRNLELPSMSMAEIEVTIAKVSGQPEMDRLPSAGVSG